MGFECCCGKRGVETGPRIPITEVDFHSRGLVSTGACPKARSGAVALWSCTCVRQRLDRRLPSHTRMSSRAGLLCEHVDRA